MKNNIFKILNIIEPILCLLTEVGAVAIAIFALGNVNWVALGGTLRESYWYEDLISGITVILPIFIIIFEIYFFFKIKNRYKLYTFLYCIVDIIIAIIIWYVNTFGMLVSILLFNLIKCIYRIKNESKLLK